METNENHNQQGVNTTAVMRSFYCTIYSNKSKCKWYNNNKDSCNECSYKAEVIILDENTIELKRGDVFKSKLNGKVWEVYETSLGKRVKLISGKMNEDYYLHMYIKYVMKAVKKGIRFQDTFILQNCA
jgi:hypothetical protein